MIICHASQCHIHNLWWHLIAKVSTQIYSRELRKVVRGVDVTIHLSNQITNLSQLMLDYGQ